MSGQAKWYQKMATLLICVLILSTFLMNSSCSLVYAQDGLAGSGTSEDPFRITTVEELKYVRTHLTASYVLMNDLSMKECKVWTPIGDELNAFTGDFEGNGYAITDFPADEDTSVFGVIDRKKDQHGNAMVETVRNFTVQRVGAESEMAALKGDADVSFLTMGGTGGTQVISCRYKKEMSDIIIPVREGYAFAGYYAMPNGEGVQYYDENGTHQSVWDRSSGGGVLFANWTKTETPIKEEEAIQEDTQEEGTLQEEIQEDEIIQEESQEDVISQDGTGTQEVTTIESEEIEASPVEAATDTGEESTKTVTNADVEVLAGATENNYDVNVEWDDVYIEYVVEKTWDPNTHTYQENVVGWRSSDDEGNQSNIRITKGLGNEISVWYQADPDGPVLTADQMKNAFVELDLELDDFENEDGTYRKVGVIQIVE